MPMLTKLPKVKTMDLMDVKSEGSPGGRRRTCVDGQMNVESQMTKCNKRWHRDLALGSVGGMDGGSQQQQNHQQQGDKITAATTWKRSPKFRGVSRHRWTGRIEAHLWDKQSLNVTQKKKGKQVYLGAYDDEEASARAYDLAALKYWGSSTFTNFPVTDYENEIEEMMSATKEEYLASLRRKSSGFSRGVSKYRGVARHHHSGRWEARIGRIFGNKYLYLGTYSTQEEAARAYDITPMTNFDLSTYIRWQKPGTSTDAAALDQQATRPRAEPDILLKNIGFNLRNKPVQHPHFSINPFWMKYIEPKDNVIMQKLPFNLKKSSSSSPTALGLLLRPPVFKELMQKNTVVQKDDTDTDDAKNTTNFSLNDDYPGILYDGTTGNSNFQYVLLGP